MASGCHPGPQAVSGGLCPPPWALVWPLVRDEGLVPVSWPVPGGPLAGPRVPGEVRQPDELQSPQAVAPVRAERPFPDAVAAQHVPVRGGQRSPGAPGAQAFPLQVSLARASLSQVSLLQVFPAQGAQRSPGDPPVPGRVRAPQGLAGSARSLKRDAIVRRADGQRGRGKPSEEVWPPRPQWDVPC
jgi:hypothetical protein